MSMPPTVRRRSKSVWQIAFEHRTVITVMLAVLSITFSLIGWTVKLQPASLREVFYLVSEVAGAFVPSASGKDFTDNGVLITAGRYLGMLATLCSAILIGFATMGQTLSSLWTQSLRRGHVVVIGDTPLSQRLVRLMRERGHFALHVIPNGPPRGQVLQPNQIAGHRTDELMRMAGLNRATTVIIDAGSDAATLSMGKAIWSALAARGGHQLERLCLRIADPVLALSTANEMLNRKPGDPPRPLLFDENQIMAQSKLRQFQLFQVAHALKQDRVHALIIGFGDLGEKILDQVMLTSIAGTLHAPMATVADRDPVSAQARFRSRRPGVLQSLEIAFEKLEMGVDALDDTPPATNLSSLVQKGKRHPFTCVFVALPQDSDTLQAVALLRRLRERHGLLDVPMIYGWRSADNWGHSHQRPWSASAPSAGDMVMALSDDDLYASVQEPERHHALAIKLHDNYRRSSTAQAEAAVSWADLPETYRRATLRAADHLPAKLWTLGIGSHSDAQGRFLFTDKDKQRLRTLAASGGDDPAIQELARVEHERWMVERKLDGWRYGPKRDNRLLIHNLLVPWKKLQKKPDEVRKDVDQVLSALKQLADTI